MSKIFSTFLLLFGFATSHAQYVSLNKIEIKKLVALTSDTYPDWQCVLNAVRN